MFFTNFNVLKPPSLLKEKVSFIFNCVCFVFTYTSNSDSLSRAKDISGILNSTFKSRTSDENWRIEILDMLSNISRSLYYNGSMMSTLYSV